MNAMQDLLQLLLVKEFAETHCFEGEMLRTGRYFSKKHLDIVVNTLIGLSSA